MKYALLLLVACRSAGSEYYTLVAPPTDKAPAQNAALQLDVLPVDVPAEVDRTEIVVREGKGKVTPVETRSWIAPLGRELRHAFSDDLTATLGARDIAGASPAAGMPTYRVKLVVQRFDSALNDRATIEAISTVRVTGSDQPPLVCSHRASEPAGSGYENLALAHQKAVEKIAHEVAAAIQSIQAGTATCSTN